MTKIVFNSVEDITEYLGDIEYLLDEDGLSDYEIVVMFDAFRDIKMSSLLNDDIDKYIDELKCKFFNKRILI